MDMIQSGKNSGNQVFNWLIMTVVVCFAALFLFPFYWMVSCAFKTQMVAVSIPPEWLPKEPTLANFQLLFKVPVVRWFFNSLFISLATTFLVCTVSAMAGYALAKKKFPGRDVIFWTFVAVMTMPKQVVLVPLFIMMRKLNLFDSYSGLIFFCVYHVGVVDPGGVYRFFSLSGFPKVSPGKCDGSRNYEIRGGQLPVGKISFQY
jgi:ABC-type glycerol-3-phosphate transport system permease component